MGGNPLVAENEGPSETSGGRLADSTWSTAKDAWAGLSGSEDFDAMSLGINGAVAALDALAFVANPFKEFVMAGVGLIIEHVDFLREPLEDLTGDPNAIKAGAQTWANISEYLKQASSDYAGEMKLEGWEGKAVDSYRKSATEYQEALNTASEWAKNVGEGVGLAGVIVATVKSLVLELICDFVARGILILVSALAGAAFSFGTSIGAGIATVVIDAVNTFRKVVDKITKLLKAASKFASRFKGLKGVANKLDDAARKVSGKLGGKQVDLSYPNGYKGGPAPFTPTEQAWRDRLTKPSGFGETPVGKAATSYPVTGAKGAAGGANNAQSSDEPDIDPTKGGWTPPPRGWRPDRKN